MRIREAVRVILVHDEKIVLVQQKSGVWVSPGGGIEEGESVEQALVRELREELSLSPDDYELLFRSTHEHRYVVPEENRTDHDAQNNILYFARLTNPENLSVNPDEIVDYRFGTIDDMSFLDAYEVSKKAQQEYEERYC